MAGDIDPGRAREVAAENLALLESQAPELAQQDMWAHQLPAPEPGCLLVAQPHKFHNTFMWQSVVFLVEHSSAGSVGLILNRPSHLEMDQLLGTKTPFSQNRLYVGGDSGDKAAVLHGRRGSKSKEVIPGVFYDQLQDLLSHPNAYTPDDCKFYAGHLHWPPGKLQKECDDGAWWPVASAVPLVLKPVLQLPKPLWCEVLELCGGTLAMIARETYQEQDRARKDRA
jgi:putative transcriptional regulator